MRLLRRQAVLSRQTHGQVPNVWTTTIGQPVQMRRAPEVSIGIHLTLTRDGPSHRWTPTAPARQVPSLVGHDGLLFTSATALRLMAQARLEDIERELRAQIDVVAGAELAPTRGCSWSPDGAQRAQAGCPSSTTTSSTASLWRWPARRRATCNCCARCLPG